MPLLDINKKPGTRVLTPQGPGKIGNQIRRDEIKVILDQKVAGIQDWFFTRGEMTLDTDYVVVRTINLDGIGLVTSAATYPAWEDALKAVKDHPYPQDETWQAINLNTGQVWSNRLFGDNFSYIISEASFDRHLRAQCHASEERSEAIAFWEKKHGNLSGTTGHLLITFFLGFENDEWCLLSFGLYSTMEIIREKSFYKKKPK